MTKLEEEVREYAKKELERYSGTLTANRYNELLKLLEESFAAGANSNHTKRKVLKGKLNLLRNFYYGEDLKDEDVLEFYKSTYELVVKDLKEQLKEPACKLAERITEESKIGRKKRFLEECASSGRYATGYYDDIISQADSCKIDDFFLNSDIVGKRKTKKLLKDNYGL